MARESQSTEKIKDFFGWGKDGRASRDRHKNPRIGTGFEKTRKNDYEGFLVSWSVFFSLAVAAVSGQGCAQIIGLEKQYPDAEDVSTDVTEDLDSIDLPDYQSDCEIQEPYQVTTQPPFYNGSRHFKLAMQDDGASGTWGALWTNAQLEDENLVFSTVRTDGALLMNPVLSVSSTNLSAFPDIAAADDGFGVVWEENISSGTDYEVQFNFISSDGLLTLDPPVSIVSIGFARVPSIVWNPDDQVFGIVWQDSRSGSYEIWFATIDREGTIGAGSRVNNQSGVSQKPDIAWTGSEYGIAWINNSTEKDSLYFERISPQGSPTSMEILVDPSTAIAVLPTIVKDSTGFALAWSAIEAGNSEIYFTRLDWPGSRSISIRQLTQGGGESKNPHLVYEPSSPAGFYHLCWEENRYSPGSPDIFVLTVDPDGNKTTGEGRVTDGTLPSAECRLALAPGVRGVFWQESIGTDRQDIFFSRFSCTD